jgi:peptidoglycan hydrolase-like protein with peptidoglycan-binding domain
MTPGQARIALLSFLLVATGVVVNALFLQARPTGATSAAIEPAARVPGERGRKSSEATAAGRHPLRIARFAPASASLDGPPDGTREDTSAKTVGAIQRELTTRGYGPLAGDGVLGLATRAAIMAFEHDQGLALTGEVSERTLERIVLGAAAGVEDAGARRARWAQAEQVIRTVQQRLAALGYQAGRADGQLGEQTVKAIRDFEMDKGLIPRGRISAELLARLGEPIAAKPPGR